MKIEQAQYNEDNLAYCDNFPQNQQLSDCSPLSNASAKAPEHHDKPHNAYAFSLKNQYKCSNDDHYKIYLCDYHYRGEKWSIEIKAISFDDAVARLKAINKGEIIGELKASIRIPITMQQTNKIFMLVKLLKNYLKS